MFEVVCIERRTDYGNTTIWTDLAETIEEAKEMRSANLDLTKRFNEKHGIVSFITIIIVEESNDVHGFGPEFFNLP